MKTHLLSNVGKGPRQFHQGKAGCLFARFLLSHGWMTIPASALFLFGSRVRTEGLLTKCDPSHPVDFGSSLFRCFLVNDLRDLCLIHVGWTVTSTWSAGFGLYLVQPPHPFFTGRFLFSSHHRLESNYRTWPATLSTALTHCVLFVSRLFPPEITIRPTLGLFVHRVRKTCLL